MSRQRELIERQAVRILFIIRFCGEETAPSLPLPFADLFDYWIESEIKLQKVEFWVRYPDYLADALLDVCSSPKTAHRRADIMGIVYKIFEDREPIVRTVPMQRLWYGAYESLDRVMSFLISRRLVKGRQQEHGHHSTAFFLTSRGSELVQRLLDECPETQWYANRCTLIREFWGHLSGSKLGKIQHNNPIYHQTQIAGLIRSIEPEVRKKYRDLFGEELPDEL